MDCAREVAFRVDKLASHVVDLDEVSNVRLGGVKMSKRGSGRSREAVAGESRERTNSHCPSHRRPTDRHTEPQPSYWGPSWCLRTNSQTSSTRE